MPIINSSILQAYWMDRHILFMHFCKNERHGAGDILFSYQKQKGGFHYESKEI